MPSHARYPHRTITMTMQVARQRPRPQPRSRAPKPHWQPLPPLRLRSLPPLLLPPLPHRRKAPSRHWIIIKTTLNPPAATRYVHHATRSLHLVPLHPPPQIRVVHLPRFPAILRRAPVRAPSSPSHRQTITTQSRQVQQRRLLPNHSHSNKGNSSSSRRRAGPPAPPRWLPLPLTLPLT